MTGRALMDRRCWLSSLSGLAGAVLLSPGAAQGALRAPSRPFRIGWLSGGGTREAVHVPPFPDELRNSPIGALIAGLRELGYVDGRNYVAELRSARGVINRLPGLALELVQWPADVIVAATAAPALAVLRATKTIPIVAVAVPNPVELGLVASLARPGGNVTGVAYTAGDQLSRMLQTLKELLPGLTRVGLLTSTADPIRQFAFARTAEFGLTPVAGDDVARSEDIAPALESVLRQKAQALVVLLGQVGFLNRRQICSFALAHRLPGICSMSEFADAGLLMTFGANLDELHRRAAVYVDKILQGARPADLPVEQPTRVDVVINLRTAQAIGVSIPSALRLRADRVID